MTFEQFQSTRTPCDDLGKLLGDCRWDDSFGGKGSGFVYLGALFIEDVKEEWPDHAIAEGKHYLLLENREWISNDLESLERKLYDFAISAGYTV